MAAPWTTSLKDVPLCGATTHGHASVPVSSGFTPPPLQGSVSFGPKVLFAAIAKVQALRTANAAITAALERSAATLTEALIDDVGSSFDLTAEADMLEATVRGALSGSVGGAFCHLCMTSLGYVWQDYAASVINSSKPLADFAYDGGAALGHGIVLAEAKGSFSGKVDKLHLEAKADAAYSKQVDNYIGATTKNGSAKVVHGYAVAFGAQPLQIRQSGAPPYAMFHVAETAPHVVGTAAPGGAAPVDSGASAPNALVALGNYRADFTLVRAPIVVEIIDRLRQNRLIPLDQLQEQRFYSVSIAGRDFLVGDPLPHADGWAYRDLFPNGQSMLAIDGEVAASFLSWLTETYMRLERSAGRVDEFSRPSVRALSPRLEAHEGALWFPDGLAVIPIVPPERTHDWSPLKGFH